MKKSPADRSVNMKSEDKPLDLEMEVYEESSDEGSSGALEIVTSETEHAESAGRERKRKRRDSSIDNEIPGVLNDMEEEIERQLDAKAAKTNLTVTNVKNILKHVISNEHVLAMVRRTITDDVDNDIDDDFPYEPKLTRAKAKELLKSQPDNIWPLTPAKKLSTSTCQVLIERELSEDSSDEEYHPNEEEQEQSDEEKENESFTSDADTQPSTPNPPTPKSFTSNDCGTQTTWTDDGLFKIPQENIGQRTRSKLSLSDTPLEAIEKAFIPPDITTDMYDSECDDEDWKDFLKNFTEPLTNVNDTFDDDEADPEYNVLADEEEQTVDKEELRVDRAVKVSKKELNLLMAELFEYADMMSSDEEDARPQKKTPLTEAQVDLHHKDSADLKENSVKMVSSREEESGEEMVYLSIEQRLLLEQQMRKHVQLTTQHFLQTYGHPVLSHLSGDFKSILVSLKYLCSGDPRSTFNAINLTGALELVDKWEKKFGPCSREGEKIKSFIQKEVQTANAMTEKKRQLYRCQFPNQLLELISRSEVFLYPLLLPPQPFRCSKFIRPSYVPSEDSLIALGLEQFEPYVKAFPPSHKISLFSKGGSLRSNTNSSSFLNRRSLIDALPFVSTYLAPTRDPKQLYFHIRKSRLIDKNPIQYYFRHNKAPITDHYVIPLTPDMVRPPCKQPRELLPEIWQDYMYPMKGRIQGPTILLLHP